MFMEAAAPSAASTVAASNESSRESGERRLATVAAVAAAEKTATPEPRAAESGKIHGNSCGYLDLMGIYGIYIMGFNGIEVST